MCCTVSNTILANAANQLKAQGYCQISAVWGRPDHTLDYNTLCSRQVPTRMHS